MAATGSEAWPDRKEKCKGEVSMEDNQGSATGCPPKMSKGTPPPGPELDGGEGMCLPDVETG